MSERTVVRLHVAESRSIGMRSGIRLSIWIDHALSEDGGPYVHDVQLTLDGEIRPGREGIARLEPLLPELWPDLQAGSRHDIWEGTNRGSWIEIVEGLIRG